MPFITDIAPQKRRLDRFSVFVDGTFAFGLHSDDLARYKLTPGEEITRERLAFLKDEIVFVKARDTALRYIAYRARSFAETLKRLETEEYPADVVQRVMMLMVKYKYVDDEQFARDYAVSRLRQGRYGPRRVKQELRMKGISETLANEALQLASEDDGETSAAREWLERKRLNLSDPAQRKRAVEALLRRGFTYTVIKEALAAIEGELDE